MKPHDSCIDASYVRLAMTLAAPFLCITTSLAQGDPLVRFDLPPLAAAIADPAEPTLVTVQLRLSSMIESAELPRVDQWLVRCQPRDRDASIADYAPRTETASDLETPIQVKKTEEQNDAFGLSLDAAYGHAIRGTTGVDHATKNTDILQFDRSAPLHAVTASGTINRGRGVYFKLRWTAKQVLEGEKIFRLTLKVPPGWRGGLIDVSVIAQSERKSFAGWDQETITIGADNFVVAVYRKGDREAAQRARMLSDAEYALRVAAAEHRARRATPTLPSMLRQVARKLDLEPKPTDGDWLLRLLLDRADPHLDEEINKLPMPIRIAVLDYADIRDDFGTINRAAQRVAAAKPAID